MNVSKINSPIGELIIGSIDNKIVGLWMNGQKYYMYGFEKEEIRYFEDEMIKKAKKWLNRYFNKKEVDINELDFDLRGSSFKIEVLKTLMTIPYGKTITYSEIASIIAKKRGIEKMSSQAVGGAVGHNPISIIIPCHRVLGKNKKLTGYAGGLEKKKYLLDLEGITYIE